MRAAVGLTDGLGLDGDRCIRVIPRQYIFKTLFPEMPPLFLCVFTTMPCIVLGCILSHKYASHLSQPKNSRFSTISSGNELVITVMSVDSLSCNILGKIN